MFNNELKTPYVVFHYVRRIIVVCFGSVLKGVKMYCPFCSFEETKVLESRVVDDSMRRRRECLKCANRFTTYERVSFNLAVIKRNGSVQPYDIQKVVNSIERACGKIDSSKVNELARKVEQKILRKKSNKVKTTLVGKFVLQELKKVNKIAYLRFASVHKKIDDPKMFEKELSLLA